MSKKSDLGKVAIGAAVGLGAGMLLAPRSGKETREILKKKIDELVDKVKHIDSDKLKKDFDKKIKSLEKELADLDKEKILAKAKKKAAVVQKKANGLAELAKEKGDEFIQMATAEIKDKAIAVTESVLRKLEDEAE